MASIQGVGPIGRRLGRCWCFAGAVFDEDEWTLSVDGVRVAIGNKPTELLHELLLHRGRVVTKDELLNAVWPGVSVVEASLPTAIAKLRRVLEDGRSCGPVIETVPRIGYRLVANVTVKSSRAETAENDTPSQDISKRRSWMPAGVAIATAVALGGLGATRILTASAVKPPPAVTRNEAMEALRRLDTVKLRELIERGWKATAPIDKIGSPPIDIALEICEWNPNHDREQLVQVVRLLLDNGAWVTDRNVFGDTPYSIAKAPRYCGPNHPVTRMLHELCYRDPRSPGDKCLATYEKKKR